MIVPLPTAGCRLDAWPDPTLAASWVLARPFRAHVRHLMDATGVPWRVLAIAAGIPSGVVESILHRHRARIRRCDAATLMGWTVARVCLLSISPTDGEPTRRRVQALLAAGHAPRLVADWLQVEPTQLAALADGQLDVVSELTALRAEAACEAHALAWRRNADEDADVWLAAA